METALSLNCGRTYGMLMEYQFAEGWDSTLIPGLFCSEATLFGPIFIAWTSPVLSRLILALSSGTITNASVSIRGTPP